jgi:protein-tyrosine phosphatase
MTLVSKPAPCFALPMNNRGLFLCTGNYYRSRYAEELFNHLARVQELDWQAGSRGLAERGSPENVGPMSRYALQALRAKAIVPLGGARYPQPCSAEDLEDARLVIALNKVEHRSMVEQRFPDAASRVTYWHIDDVAFAPPSVALAMVDDRVDELISSLGPPRGTL